jgi:hypothetical protein
MQFQRGMQRLGSKVQGSEKKLAELAARTDDVERRGSEVSQECAANVGALRQQMHEMRDILAEAQPND